MKLPVVETERLRMRMYRQEDLEAFYEIACDPQVRRYFPEDSKIERGDVLTSLPRRLDYWRQNGFGQFGVFEKGSGKLIGYCGLKNLENTDEIEIYYGYARDSWGRSYATEAAAAVLRFGFEETDLERIVAITHTENTASQKVIEKIGLKWERYAVFYGLDVNYSALMKAEYAGGPEYDRKWQEVDE